MNRLYIKTAISNFIRNVFIVNGHESLHMKTEQNRNHMHDFLYWNVERVMLLVSAVEGHYIQWCICRGIYNLRQGVYCDYLGG